MGKAATAANVKRHSRCSNSVGPARAANLAVCQCNRGTYRMWPQLLQNAGLPCRQLPQSLTLTHQYLATPMAKARFAVQ